MDTIKERFLAYRLRNTSVVKNGVEEKLLTLFEPFDAPHSKRPKKRQYKNN